MKKLVIVLALSVLCSISACSDRDVSSISDSGQNDVVNGVLDESSSGENFDDNTEVNADGEKVINIVVEDGTNYCIYISSGGSVEAVKNLDTREWPVKSER